MQPVPSSLSKNTLAINTILLFSFNSTEKFLGVFNGSSFPLLVFYDGLADLVQSTFLDPINTSIDTFAVLVRQLVLLFNITPKIWSWLLAKQLLCSREDLFQISSAFS
eukprot:scaffold4131_cov94-Cylindrotheca_fusiformis.AAC.1